MPEKPVNSTIGVTFRMIALKIRMN